jgi:hypothetical protein
MWLSSEFDVTMEYLEEKFPDVDFSNLELLDFYDDNGEHYTCSRYLFEDIDGKFYVYEEFDEDFSEADKSGPDVFELEEITLEQWNPTMIW